MKSWFSERNAPAPGMTDDELPGWPIPVASRACCCPATPVVTVIMPPTAARRHPVDLLLCGHHYRAAQAALRAAGATVYDRSGTQLIPLTVPVKSLPASPSRRAGTTSPAEARARADP